MSRQSKPNLPIVAAYLPVPGRDCQQIGPSDGKLAVDNFYSARVSQNLRFLHGCKESHINSICYEVWGKIQRPFLSSVAKVYTV